MSNKLNLFLLLLLIIQLSISQGPKQSKKLKKSKFCKINTNQKHKPFSPSICSIITEGPLCIKNNKRMILPYASPKGCINFLDFDQNIPVDNSGFHNHPLRKVEAGPAFGGFGSSGLFQNGNFLEIPFKNDFYSINYSFSFFYYLIDDSYSRIKGSRHCPILQRGNDDLYSKNFERSPSLQYDRKQKRLRVYVKTMDPTSNKGEFLISNSRITSLKWYHIAVVKEKSYIKLYINGILDSKLDLKDTPIQNKSNLYLGGVPWLADQCNFPFLIDEFRYYNTVLNEDYIQAEASPVLGSIEPSFIQLGCVNCGLKKASISCSEGYHVCTSVELHTGGYQIARTMGWLNWNTHIWSHSALKVASNFNKVKGLSICCSDLK